MPDIEDKEPENKEKPNETTDNLDTPEEDAPLLEPEGQPDDVSNEDNRRVHPLSKGGIRFEQIYAKGKQAERDLVESQTKLKAAEARIAELEGKTTNETTEYSWAQLEEFIAQGRITRADAEAHREAVITKRVLNNVKTDVTKESAETTRNNALQSHINTYLEAIPEIKKEGTDARERVEEEFAFQASIHGFDVDKLTDVQRRQLQLSALRAVHGPIDAVTKRERTVRTETHQGLPGGARPASRVNPDQEILNKLTKREVAHYTNMMKNGRYPKGWSDVVAEIKFDPKTALQKKR